MSRTDHPDSRCRWPLSLGGFLLPVLLLGPGKGVEAQAPGPEPLAELRQVLRNGPADPQVRDRQTKQCLAGLHTLEDWQHALILPDWHHDHPDSALAAVDRANRAVVAERFTQAARTALGSSDPVVVREALDLVAGLAEAARNRGEPPSSPFRGPAGRLAPELALVTRRGPPEVHAAAARTLGQVGAEVSVAVPALADLLKGKDAGLRLAAAEGLAGLLRSAAPDAAGLPGTTLSGDVIRVAGSVLPALRPGLNDTYPEVKRCSVGTIGLAAAALARLAADHCRDAEETLKGPDLLPAPKSGGCAELRPLALILRDQGPALNRALGDSDVEVRLLAQKALEELGYARRHWLRGQPGPEDDPLLDVLRSAVPGLADAAAHPDVQVRRSAVGVLETLDLVAAPAAPALAEDLNDPDPFVRWSSARTLGGLGPQAARWARPGLVRLLKDPDPDVRQAAAAALKRLNHPGPETSVHLASARSESTGPAASPPGWPDQVRSLHAGAAEMRLAACRDMQGTIMDPRLALPELVKALADPDPRVRRAAAEALASLGPAAREAVGPLRRALEDPGEDVRRAAEHALSRINPTSPR